MNTKILTAAGLVGLAGAGAGYLWLKAPQKAGETTPHKSSAAAAVKPAPDAKRPAAAAPAAAAGRAAQAEPGQPVAAAGATNAPTLSPEQAAADKMEERLDNEDHAAVLTIARPLMHAKDPEVRSRVISALGWIGVKALPELSEMLADEQESIAAEAFQQWKDAVGEVADEAMKANLVVAGMLNMKKQGDLEDCVMEFNTMREDVAVRGLVTVIQSSNPVASEVARDHYSFVTGEAYTSAENAEKWIAENVEPVEEKPAETTAK